MKSLKIAVTALVIAGGTFGAFAFTKANTETKKSEMTNLHWFDANTGDPLPDRTVEQQQAACGQPGDIDCAFGYTSLDPQGNPVGSPTVIKRQ